MAAIKRDKLAVIKPLDEDRQISFLNDKCRKYKTYLEKSLGALIAAEWHHGSFEQELQFKSKEIYLYLQSLKAKLPIAPHDIEFIVTKVIPQDPPATYIGKHVALYHAVQRVRAVNNLLDVLSKRAATASEKLEKFADHFVRDKETITTKNSGKYLEEVIVLLASRGIFSVSEVSPAANNRLFSSRSEKTNFVPQGDESRSRHNNIKSHKKGGS